MLLPPVGLAPATARGYITLNAIDPYSFGNDGTFLLSVPMINDLEQNGPTQKFCDAALIPEALERPTVILEGLKRTNYAAGLCYCTVPTERWTHDANGEMQRIKPPMLKVFSVYVNPVGDNLFVLDFDWRVVGPGGTGIPYRWQRDFE
ncbi:MAG TPA: hypothetical protein VFW33_16865, partial [Gemmataceae bacterium]|nr:hypothetical protein [Gemmataceae bacterium]